MNSGLGYGIFYVAAHQTWAWTFRFAVDPWLRAVASRRARAAVVWLPATTFPFPVSAWGIARPDRPASGRLAAWCAAACLAGAFIPIVVLCAMLDVLPCAPRLSQVLYLMTMPMMALFIGVQTRGRDEADAQGGEDDLGGEPPPSRKLRNEDLYRPKEGGVL
jgi:hypothetical protein